MNKRNSGILLHITSLPGDEGVGTLGENAYRFVDFLIETGQKIWQILPLGPVGFGDSPYQCYSAFAGNHYLIDLKLLVADRFLVKKQLNDIPLFSKKEAEFEKIAVWKNRLLKLAFGRFTKSLKNDYGHEYNSFLKEHSWWLNDYAFFMAAKEHFGELVWNEWNDGLKYRKEDALKEWGGRLADNIEFHKFLQFLFFRQWFKLKEYANSKGIEIIGDLPLYVSTDSVDIWTNPDLFSLDGKLKPLEVGGVPPDYFSEIGQLWGNPVYNWHNLKERGYDWWLARLHFNINMFNRVRIDHFRGLESFWSVAATETNAINGKWVKAPGHELLARMKDHIGELPFIAEDLGLITEDVDKLRTAFNLPGMKVLQFAYTSDATNVHMPHNYTPGFVVYSGTHDNDTTLGWLKNIDGEEQKMVEKYLGAPTRRTLRKVVENAFASVAETAIVPMQDILELDTQARMNVPGTSEGNWKWRFSWQQLKTQHKNFLSEITEKYNRKQRP